MRLHSGAFTPSGLNRSLTRRSLRSRSSSMSLSPRSRSTLPMLQSQSAESHLGFLETRSETTRLKLRLHRLKSLKAALISQHSTAVSMMLKNEESLISAKSQAKKPVVNRTKDLEEAWKLLQMRLEAIQEARSKHLREIELYKQSVAERIGTLETRNTVLDLMRQQMAIYETQITNLTNEEKELEEKYRLELAVEIAAKGSFLQELHSIRSTEVSKLQSEARLRRRLQLLETVIPLPVDKKLEAEVESQHRSSRELLVRLKMKLRGSSGRMLR